MSPAATKVAVITGGTAGVGRGSHGAFDKAHMHDPVSFLAQNRVASAVCGAAVAGVVAAAAAGRR